MPRPNVSIPVRPSYDAQPVPMRVAARSAQVRRFVIVRIGRSPSWTRASLLRPTPIGRRNKEATAQLRESGQLRPAEREVVVAQKSGVLPERLGWRRRSFLV